MGVRLPAWGAVHAELRVHWGPHSFCSDWPTQLPLMPPCFWGHSPIAFLNQAPAPRCLYPAPPVPTHLQPESERQGQQQDSAGRQ